MHSAILIKYIYILTAYHVEVSGKGYNNKSPIPHSPTGAYLDLYYYIYTHTFPSPALVSVFVLLGEKPLPVRSDGSITDHVKQN